MQNIVDSINGPLFSTISRYYEGGKITFTENQDVSAKTIVHVSGVENKEEAEAKGLHFLEKLLVSGEDQKSPVLIHYEQFSTKKDFYFVVENDIYVFYAQNYHLVENVYVG